MLKRVEKSSGKGRSTKLTNEFFHIHIYPSDFKTDAFAANSIIRPSSITRDNFSAVRSGYLRTIEAIPFKRRLRTMGLAGSGKKHECARAIGDRSIASFNRPHLPRYLCAFIREQHLSCGEAIVELFIQNFHSIERNRSSDASLCIVTLFFTPA